MTRLFLGEFLLFRIFARELAQSREPPPGPERFAFLEDVTEVLLSPDPDIRATAECALGNALGFGAWVDGELASVCWVWDRETCVRHQDAGAWPPGPGEGKTVAVATAANLRNQGLAQKLLAFAGCRMRERGMARLVGRVAVRNRASIAAIRKNGSRQVGWLLDYYPFGLRKRLRIVWRTRYAASPQRRSAAVIVGN